MPIFDFLQDSDGDLAVVNSGFAVAGGNTNAENVAAVAQLIRIALRMFLGECFLDESIGVDWLGEVLVKGANPSAINARLAAVISGVAGGGVVTAVVSVGLVLSENRSASVSYSVLTVYSSDPLTGTVTA